MVKVPQKYNTAKARHMQNQKTATLKHIGKQVKMLEQKKSATANTQLANTPTYYKFIPQVGTSSCKQTDK